ncbi:uncharacterized protein J3D65DRAFT_77933 [Phyllosticta citribraziliensis]|uniref:M-phase inducer phosphatase n=1 Tax=Phyllosticta citribraziliensis TaxID=989973 RepID=A0ABR1LDI9_9PEZI
MESSPLAVMQPPPSPGTWGYRRDLASTRPRFSSLGANSFNFKDLSMKKSSADYFNTKAARGSSPTVSLAADLAQNFTIDQSPQLPTPRRSLFTANLFQKPEEGATTPCHNWREGVTTPPIPSSSPGFTNDSMDISPLPHKPAHGLVARVTVQSPTPEPQDQDMNPPCSPPPNPLLDSPMLAPERKKPTFPLRPSLSRAKAYSSATVNMQSKDNSMPFQFNTSSGAPGQDSDMLSQCFKPSPVQDRRLSFHLQERSRSGRHPTFNSSMFNRCNGSPVPGIRKSGAARPRKQFRRTMSMFESPGDVMNTDQKEVGGGLASIMDVDDVPQLKLPTLPSNGEPNSLPRINCSTLIDVLNGQYNEAYNETLIIDCRFEYEYEGGHIDGAVNFCEREALADKLFDPYTDYDTPRKTLLVFHCEYSELRAPRMAEFIRSRDRHANEDNYPRLTYPEVYILHGGYSSFYDQFKPRCFPQNYLRMESEEHERACEAGLHKLKQRVKLSRAQTFAFGEHGCDMEDSPTAPSRSRPAMASMDSMHDSNASSRAHARRMASY